MAFKHSLALSVFIWGKTLSRILFSLVFSLGFFAYPSYAGDGSDAIAVRVIDNPNHYGIERWYKMYGPSGNVKSLQVDGYDAIWNGRTVYVNAANISDSDDDGEPDTFDTYVFLLSYTQGQQESTISIFSQLLKNFKFNTNLSETGVCSGNEEKNCRDSSECAAEEYCQSEKAEVVRDVKRLADLADLQAMAQSYKDQHGKYPTVLAGTYVKGRSLSVWPSWQSGLAKDLGGQLPVDPVNRLGACSGFDPVTCWDSRTSRFAADINGGILPSGSYVYMYMGDERGTNAKFCAQMESNLRNLDSFNCFEDKQPNRQPVIKDVSLYGWPKQKFTGYVSVYDADGDRLRLTVELVEPSPSEWTGNKWQLNPVSVSALPGGQMKISFPLAGNARPVGYYKVRLTVDDGQGEKNSSFSGIYNLVINSFPASISQESRAVLIGQSDSCALSGMNSNGDPITELYVDSAFYNKQLISNDELPERGFSLVGAVLNESYKPAQRTGDYEIKVYAEDPVAGDGRVTSSFFYRIINHPPEFKRLLAVFSNGTSQVCGPGEACNLVIDNGEKATISIAGKDSDSGHSVSYSLVKNPGGVLDIDVSSGMISGFEKLSWQEMNDKVYEIAVKMQDNYCGNSAPEECSSVYSFNLKVMGYCSVDSPESTTHVTIDRSFVVSHSGDRVDTGFSLDDCSAVAKATMDVKFSGESHSQDIVLVSDLSSSMEANVVIDGRAQSAISRLKNSLTSKNNGFLDSIYAIASALPPEYAIRVGLIGYNDSVVSKRNLTDVSLPGAITSMKNTINSYSTNYQTNTLLALNTAETLLKEASDSDINRERIVVLMSDGIPGVDGWKIYNPYCKTIYSPPECRDDLPDCPAGQLQVGCWESYCYTVSCNCGGTYPNCTPAANCPFGQSQGGCTIEDCYTPPHSSFDQLSPVRRLFARIFGFKAAKAMTPQNECTYKTCETAFPSYPSCPEGQTLGCSMSYPILDCDLTPDVDEQSKYLKANGVTVYAVYYNTSDTLDPQQRMCDWSSNDGVDCDNGKYFFSGSDIDMMTRRVLGRIVIKPKDVFVGSSPVEDSNIASTTSFVDDAPIGSLGCGSVNPLVTYSNNGYLEFSDIQIDYCPAKLHP